MTVQGSGSSMRHLPILSSPEMEPEPGLILQAPSRARHTAGCFPYKQKSDRVLAPPGSPQDLGRQASGEVLMLDLLFSFPSHPLIENDSMQLSAWRPWVSAPQPVPIAQIPFVMTSST